MASDAKRRRRPATAAEKAKAIARARVPQEAAYVAVPLTFGGRVVIGLYDYARKKPRPLNDEEVMFAVGILNEAEAVRAWKGDQPAGLDAAAGDLSPLSPPDDPADDPAGR